MTTQGEWVPARRAGFLCGFSMGALTPFYWPQTNDARLGTHCALSHPQVGPPSHTTARRQWEGAQLRAPLCSCFLSGMGGRVQGKLTPKSPRREGGGRWPLPRKPVVILTLGLHSLLRGGPWHLRPLLPAAPPQGTAGEAPARTRDMVLQGPCP